MNTRIVFALIACHLAAALSGCEYSPDPRAHYSDLLQVISPEGKTLPPKQGYTLTPLGRHVSIQVTFTQPVDPTTLIARQTVVLHFAGDPNADAQLALSADKRVLTITTRNSFFELTTPFNPFTPDTRFSLRLKGNARRPSGMLGPVIKSSKGHVLDGNRDSKDGGDYKTSFS